MDVPSSITFRVRGTPAPGGSKRAFPFRRKNGRLGVSVVDDAKGNKSWRRLVAMEGIMAMAGKSLFLGPLIMEVTFIMPRPKAHFNTKGNLHPWAAAAYPMKKPDRTKLLRSTEDALTGIVWKDDTQVVGGPIHKRYRALDEKPGAIITVTAAELLEATP